MSSLRRCPVCKEMNIRRAEVHTCGAKECVAFWKSMRSNERMRAIREAELPLGFSTELPPTPDAPDPAYVVKAMNDLPDALKKTLGIEEPSQNVCEAHGKVMCFICAGIMKEKKDKEDE